MRAADRVASWLLPTLGGLLTVAAYAFALFLRGEGLFGGDGDVGRHVRVGTDILASKTIPRVDVYSHTMGGEKFVPYEWLSEVTFAWAHQLAGLAGIVVLSGLLFAGAVGLVYLTMTRWGVPAFLAFAFGFASLVLQSIHLLPRPHLFTTLLVALYALILHDVRRGAPRARLLFLPLLMVVWANLHGGFLLGFILVFLFVLDAAWEAWRHPGAESKTHLRWMVGVVGLCFAASLLTPAGIELWPHTTGYLKLEFLVDWTSEYQSPDFHDTLIKTFMVALLYGVCVLAWLRSRVDLLGLAAFVLFAAFALHSTRNIPIFAVVCVPWLAIWTKEVLAQGGTESRSAGFLRWADNVDEVTGSLAGWPVALAACAALTALALSPNVRQGYRWDAAKYPVAAVENLGPVLTSGPVFNQFKWGGYLLYAAWPDVPVFIDGQTDFYGEELTRQYMDIRDVQPGWRDLLDEYGVAWALIPPDAPLASALEILPEWEQVYRDSTAVAFSRGRGPEAP